MQGRQVIVYDRENKREEVEKVYGARSLLLLSGGSIVARGIISVIKRHLFAGVYARFHRTALSRRKIKKVIDRYGIDTSEFVKDIEEFGCFNDFFTRELKKEKRPLAGGDLTAVMPCDARYLVFEKFSEDRPIVVKDVGYYLHTLLRDEDLVEKYRKGAMTIIRLDPTDYHRIHFPFDCVPGNPRLINGYLYPVNPYVLYRNLRYYLEDKRVVTSLRSEVFGEVLFIEIGAATVGSINQTFQPGDPCRKGEQKAYFSFGGSSVIMLFEEGRIAFDDELLVMTARDIEVKGKYGQSLGRARHDM